MIATFDPRPPGEPLAKVLASLGPRERAVFGRLRRSDQRHSLQLSARAQVRAPNDPVLWHAALLHDVGKGRPALVDRIVLTLLASWAPSLLLRWRRLDRGISWRGRLAHLAQHTEHSARYAELADAPAEVVQTLRAYGWTEHPRGDLLAELDSAQ